MQTLHSVLELAGCLIAVLEDQSGAAQVMDQAREGYFATEVVTTAWQTAGRGIALNSSAKAC